MKSQFLRIANGLIGLAVLVMLTVALIAGQARAIPDESYLEQGQVISIDMTLSLDELPLDNVKTEVKKALSQ